MRLYASALLLAGFLFTGPVNFASAQVEPTVDDRDMRVVHFEELRYPQLARSAHVEGLVVVRVKLNDQGGVTDAIAISGAAVLVHECLTNAKKWTFQPNAQHSAVIVYRFTLPKADCASVTSFFMLEGVNLANITACPLTVEP